MKRVLARCALHIPAPALTPVTSIVIAAKVCNTFSDALRFSLCVQRMNSKELS
jgi:hypothetical protein